MNTCAVLLLGLVLGQTSNDSLPKRTGDVVVESLREDSVELRIDDQGVPWVVAGTMQGLVQGEGFLHGQDRFFQMDLMRRYAAGEMSILFGPSLRLMDISQRPYLQRTAAERIFNALPAVQQDLLWAYSDGVNAGVADLGSPPPEYLMLQQSPVPWTPQDSILVLLSMGEQLTSTSARRELDRQRIRNLLSDEEEFFLFDDVHENDVPMLHDSEPPALAPIPQRTNNEASDEVGRTSLLRRRMILGSNAWAVAGTRTEHGGAMVANDPHLGITSPGPWYRIGLFVPAGSPASWDPAAGDRGDPWWVFGLSLPGVPGVAIGTNGFIAWGMTNSEMDTQDLVKIEEHPTNTEMYRIPGENGASEPAWEHYTWQSEIIEVAGAEPVEIEIPSTRWGPVFNVKQGGIPLVRMWTMTEPGGLNLDILDVPRARSVDEAIEVFAGWNGPPQNAIIGDRDGNIGWVLTGALPNRAGMDGTVPMEWTEAGVGWNGWMEESEHPRVVNPPSGMLFNANNRMVNIDLARKLGRDWAPPVRANRISTMLESQEQFKESDMLAMQLDTAVPLLEPLRERLLQVIPEDDSDESVRRARQYVAEWNGTADADQQGFRILVMVDRGLQDEMMWEMLPDDEEVQFGIPAAPLRRLIDEDVQEYMPSRFEEWSELDEATFRRMVRDIEMRKTEGEGIDLDWGEVNRSQFIHPFSMSGSALGSDRLNLPSHPQSGHPLAVRVAHPRFGASARMVVSPGREQDAILQTPGGQSGHFLSPYMSNFHEQWRTGEPTDLLPGEPVTIIRLVREDSEGE